MHAVLSCVVRGKICWTHGNDGLFSAQQEDGRSELVLAARTLEWEGGTPAWVGGIPASGGGIQAWEGGTPAWGGTPARACAQARGGTPARACAPARASYGNGRGSAS